MIAFIGNPTGGASVPSGDPEPDLGVIASAGLAWRSPTDDQHTDGCLQVAADGGRVFIRDSAAPEEFLSFTLTQFTAFCNAVCAGRYRDILPRVV